jgi:hypothetical protein
MHIGIRYTILFLVVALLQSLVFNQAQISVWLNPLVYVAFVMLLPMRTPSIVVLMCGLLAGVSMDLISGLAGVNTIASLATAYFRPLMLKPVIGEEAYADGGIPAPRIIGVYKFVAYATLFVMIHNLLYFSFEAMTLSYFYLILLKVLLNGIISALLVTLIALMFVSKNHN